MVNRRGAPRKYWRYLLLAGLLVVAAASGSMLGYFMQFDLPDVRALEDYDPPTMTRVLAKDGSLVGTFAEQRRILIRHGEIPQIFKQALVAIEDSDFHLHTGIDFKGILRAAWRDVRTLSLAEGASTLTQQLARNLFLHRRKTIRRKLQEVVLALEIERRYSKQEILRFYCNQIYTGHGRYGIEAASRYYFGKPAREMDLNESATLAGLIQRPEALSPFKHPERSLRRRNAVLRRMLAEGYLTQDELDLALETPLPLRSQRRSPDHSPYFVEEVRRWLQAKYGSSSLYKEGLVVSTTLDPELQPYANEAMDLGLHQLDRRQGWRGVSARVPAGEDPQTWAPPSWSEDPAVGVVHDGVVTAVEPGKATVRVGPYSGALAEEQIRWTKTADPSELLEVGDRIRVRLLAVAEDGSAELALEQEPIVEAALIAIEPATGAIRALVGGFDFERSEFDRAIQARRQTGSAFKPFVYAAALTAGWTLADTILDEPTVFLDGSREAYQPENFGHKYYRRVTLRKALERSANVATVKLLDKIGYDAVIQLTRRLGITSQLQPFPSLALGAFESTLVELTSAYGVFANQGVHVRPYLVEEVRNHQGAFVEQVEPVVHDAVQPEIAYVMNQVLRGVVSDGTGRRAASLGYPLAGKTGTTDNNTDAWFIGYSPGLAVGVWVGFDEPRSLGSRETGALAALPIWRAFMERALPHLPREEFPRPPGVAVLAIDRLTGLKANRAANCKDVFTETFIEGTGPTRYCSKQRHQLLGMPYPFERYALNDRGELMVPADELDALLAAETEVYLIEGGRRLEAHTKGGTYQLPLSILPATGKAPLPAAIGDRYDVEGWLGTDGREARILRLD